MRPFWVAAAQPVRTEAESSTTAFAMRQGKEG